MLEGSVAEVSADRKHHFSKTPRGSVLHVEGHGRGQNRRTGLRRRSGPCIDPGGALNGSFASVGFGPPDREMLIEQWETRTQAPPLAKPGRGMITFRSAGAGFYLLAPAPYSSRSRRISSTASGGLAASKPVHPDFCQAALRS